MGKTATRAAVVCLAFSAFVSVGQASPVRLDPGLAGAGKEIVVSLPASQQDSVSRANAGPSRYMLVAAGDGPRGLSRSSYVQPVLANAGVAAAAAVGEEEAMASPGMILAGLLVVGLIAVRRMAG